MKVSLFLSSLVLFVSLFMGVASGSPSSSSLMGRPEYSRSLNSIATVMMNWYGSLIENKQGVSFSPLSLKVALKTYRSHYPKNIQQILITKTNLLKQDNDYLFRVKTKIIYQQDKIKKAISQNEEFIFNKNLLYKAEIKDALLIDRKNITLFKADSFNRLHYKVREFTYAWLSYLDGVKEFKPIMNAEAWLNTASYSLNIANQTSKGSVHKVLKKRALTLNKGGHLLQQLKRQQLTNNQFTLDLILEWKGFNNKNKPVLARIHQQLTIKINADKQWEVDSIKENHLLPIIAPWMGLLC